MTLPLGSLYGLGAGVFSECVGRRGGGGGVYSFIFKPRKLKFGKEVVKIALALQCILQYKLINIFSIKCYFRANLKIDVTKNGNFLLSPYICIVAAMLVGKECPPSHYPIQHSKYLLDETESNIQFIASGQGNIERSEAEPNVILYGRNQRDVGRGQVQ